MAEHFISAGAAGEGRLTVVIPVGTIPSEKRTAWPSNDIDGQPKAERPTGKRKEGEGCMFLKKPWLIPLQHLHPHVIGYLKITRLSSLVAIFAVEKVWLWPISLDEAMGDGIQ
ncbi:MAG: hypothetical protein GY799_09520 [Desulfobulbaceae bacterium]|nr:hypothetical protein [Desulfobulbaceae bacterium]